ncbi:unnamed protein product, partial [Discosporangium mesarthrocarpum]
GKWKACAEAGPGRGRRGVDEGGSKKVRWQSSVGTGYSLSSPQPYFSVIRECYPHFLHGRSKAGEVVVYECSGRMKFGRLASMGITPEGIQAHYSFLYEFVWTRLAPGEDSRLVTILDVGGLTLSTFRNNAMIGRYLRATAEMMEKNYPGRQGRVVMINAPWWVGGVWKGPVGMLSSLAQQRCRIMGKDFLEELLEYLDIDQIPQEYQGKSPYPLGNHPDDIALRCLAAANTAASLSDSRVALEPSSLPLGHQEAPSHVMSSPRATNSPGDSGWPGAPFSLATDSSLAQRLASLVPQRPGWGRGSGGATHAFLGVENRFRYDQERKMWVMEG